MRKNYNDAFKAKVVLEMLREEKTIAEIAAEYDVHPTQLNTWKALAFKNMATVFSKENKKKVKEEAAQEQKINNLYAEIDDLTTQLSWLKKKSGIDPKQ